MAHLKQLSLFVGLLLAPGDCFVDKAQRPPRADTQNGPVEGLLRGSTASWWGIPFAEPPLKELRFRLPQELRRNWTEPFQATRPASPCTQLGATRGTLFGNEDCLYLNVHAPAARPDGSLRPVMVWLHGGGYMFGDGYEHGLYDGKHLSERHDVVVVTLNYRLCMLGFFAIDALRQEEPFGSTGNYGLQDQQLALRWVQRNVRSFGGDPDRVTLSGESAGGISVMWHLVSPKSAGLFHAAIIESGTSAVSWFFQPYDLASEFYEGVSAHIGCPAFMGARQLACLRAKPYNDFAQSVADWAWDALNRQAKLPPADMPAVHSPLWPVMPVGPVIDGTEYGLPGVPIQLVRSGKFNHVPLVLGANENGGSIFEPQMPMVVPGAVWPASLRPESDLRKAMDYFFQEHANTVLAMYKLEEYKLAEFPADALVSRMIRDLIFQCSNRAVANAWAQAGLPAYMYVFHFNFGALDKVAHLGDFHASEIPFVFRNWLTLVASLAPLSNPWKMADIMSCKWASFAYTHDPNGGKNESAWPPNCGIVNRELSLWPQYSLDKRLYYVLRDDPEVLQVLADNRYPDDIFPRDPKCNLWDQLSANLPWIRESHNATSERPDVSSQAVYV